MCLGKGANIAFWAVSERKTKGGSQACIKIVPIYIMEFVFLLTTSCPEGIGTSSVGVIQCSLPIELLEFTSAMCQTCNLAVGKEVYSSPPPAVWNSLISSHCHTMA